MNRMLNILSSKENPGEFAKEIEKFWVDEVSDCCPTCGSDLVEDTDDEMDFIACDGFYSGKCDFVTDKVK